jgi:C1A family cysteine protease
MKKFLFIILSLILCIPTVYALDECTPSDEYLEYLSLSEEERSNMIEPFKCKEMLNLNDNTVSVNINRDLDSFLGASVNLSRYNAKDDNLVSPVQNQYKDGTCWAFSSLSVVETNAMKNGLPAYNLSEAHMAYSLIDDFYIDSPGRTNKYFSDKLGGKIT